MECGLVHYELCGFDVTHTRRDVAAMPLVEWVAQMQGIEEMLE